jgi:hypothetical protein
MKHDLLAAGANGWQESLPLIKLTYIKRLAE